MKNLGKYHYVQRNKLLLGYVFENCENDCLEIYEVDKIHFLTALESAQTEALKKQQQNQKYYLMFIC